MSRTIDVYREWLKIPDENRPLDHYQLLRLKRFEDNPAKVREHYRKMNSHVRKYAAGEFAKQSQDLLNELARAMLCLTDIKRKGEYDSSLGRKQAGEAKARTFEEILLATQVVDRAALDKAHNFSKAVGVEVRDALVQQKLAKYDAVLPAYAESIGLPYLDLVDIPLDGALIARIPSRMARQHSCVPVMIDQDHLLMASPNPIDPDVEEELRMRFGMSVRTVLCTPANIDDAITKFVPRDGTGDPMPAAASKAGSAKEAAADKPAKPAGEPMTIEDKKQRLQISLMAMGLTTIVLFNALYQVMDYGGWVAAAISLTFSAVAFGVAWKVKSH